MRTLEERIESKKNDVKFWENRYKRRKDDYTYRGLKKEQERLSKLEFKLLNNSENN